LKTTKEHLLTLKESLDSIINALEEQDQDNFEYLESLEQRIAVLERTLGSTTNAELRTIHRYGM
jgi:uncharacterized protein YaaN involved in tellurite resistance